MTDEERESRLDRLCDLLEQYLESRNAEGPEPDLVESSAAADTRSALDAMLKLKPYVERNGDRHAIASYRGAVRELRRQAAADARTLTPESEGRNYGPDFFEQTRRYHRQRPQDVKATEEQEERSAQDANSDEVDFFAASRRLHRKNIRPK